MLTLSYGKKKFEIQYQLIIVIILLTFSLLYFFESKDLSYEALLFPRFLFVMIGITGILTIKQSIRIYNNLEENKQLEIRCSKININRNMIKFIVLIALSLITLKVLGSIISIPLFLVLAMKSLGVKNKKVVILVSIITVIFIYGVFQMWLSIQLPSGILGF